jgi:CheY-like chemotaxis protein
MEKPLILIIDRSEYTRAMYGDCFRHHGYAVMEAADGVEGLNLFREVEPDLVVTEVSRDPDWIEAIRAMRSPGPGRHTATIACSVTIDPAWPFAPAGFDVDLALAKPISPRALLLQAERVLAVRSRRGRARALAGR